MQLSRPDRSHFCLECCILLKLLKDVFLAKLPLLIDLIGLDLGFTCKVGVPSSSLLVLALLLQFPALI